MVDVPIYGHSSLDVYLGANGWNVQNFGVGGRQSRGLNDEITECFKRETDYIPEILDTNGVWIGGGDPLKPYYTNFITSKNVAFEFLDFGLIVFILRKNISAPYFKLYPRGWRGKKRNPIEVNVVLDDKEFKTKDISSNGIYLDWKDCDKNLGDEVVLEFKEDISLVPRTTKAGIVRIDETGVGLAFRK